MQFRITLAGRLTTSGSTAASMCCSGSSLAYRIAYGAVAVKELALAQWCLPCFSLGFSCGVCWSGKGCPLPASTSSTSNSMHFIYFITYVPARMACSFSCSACMSPTSARNLGATSQLWQRYSTATILRIGLLWIFCHRMVDMLDTMVLRPHCRQCRPLLQQACLHSCPTSMKKSCRAHQAPACPKLPPDHLPMRLIRSVGCYKAHTFERVARQTLCWAYNMRTFVC